MAKGNDGVYKSSIQRTFQCSKCGPKSHLLQNNPRLKHLQIHQTRHSLKKDKDETSTAARRPALHRLGALRQRNRKIAKRAQEAFLKEEAKVKRARARKKRTKKLS